MQGNYWRPAPDREVAIYLRDGSAWAAEFRGRSARLHSASEWLVAQSRSAAMRSAILGGSATIPAALVPRIEALHRAVTTPGRERLRAAIIGRAARLVRLLRQATGCSTTLPMPERPSTMRCASGA